MPKQLQGVPILLRYDWQVEDKCHKGAGDLVFTEVTACKSLLRSSTFTSILQPRKKVSTDVRDSGRLSSKPSNTTDNFAKSIETHLLSWLQHIPMTTSYSG